MPNRLFSCCFNKHFVQNISGIGNILYGSMVSEHLSHFFVCQKCKWNNRLVLHMKLLNIHTCYSLFSSRKWLGSRLCYAPSIVSSTVISWSVQKLFGHATYIAFASFEILTVWWRVMSSQMLAVDTAYHSGRLKSYTVFNLINTKCEPALVLRGKMCAVVCFW